MIGACVREVTVRHDATCTASVATYSPTTTRLLLTLPGCFLAQPRQSYCRSTLSIPRHRCKRNIVYIVATDAHRDTSSFSGRFLVQRRLNRPFNAEDWNSAQFTTLDPIGDAWLPTWPVWNMHHNHLWSSQLRLVICQNKWPLLHPEPQDHGVRHLRGSGFTSWSSSLPSRASCYP